MRQTSKSVTNLLNRPNAYDIPVDGFFKGMTGGPVFGASDQRSTPNISAHDAY